MTGKYTKYKPEFRDEIAKLIVESNRPIAEVAREYGLNETTVGGWVKKYRAAHDPEKIVVELQPVLDAPLTHPEPFRTEQFVLTLLVPGKYSVARLVGAVNLSTLCEHDPRRRRRTVRQRNRMYQRGDDREFERL